MRRARPYGHVSARLTLRGEIGTSDVRLGGTSGIHDLNGAVVRAIDTAGGIMIILGIVLLLLGLLLKISILWTIGIIVLVVGLVLLLLGSTGRAVGGRRHFF
jgi:hypothetical protein